MDRLWAAQKVEVAPAHDRCKSLKDICNMLKHNDAVPVESAAKPGLVSDMQSYLSRCEGSLPVSVQCP